MSNVGKYDSSLLPKRCIQTQRRRVAYGTSFGRKGPVGLFGPVGFKDAGWLRRLLDTKTPGPVPSLRSNCVQALKRRTARTWRSGPKGPGCRIRSFRTGRSAVLPPPRGSSTSPSSPTYQVAVGPDDAGAAGGTGNPLRLGCL